MGVRMGGSRLLAGTSPTLRAVGGSTEIVPEMGIHLHYTTHTGWQLQSSEHAQSSTLIPEYKYNIKCLYGPKSRS